MNRTPHRFSLSSYSNSLFRKVILQCRTLFPVLIAVYIHYMQSHFGFCRIKHRESYVFPNFLWIFILKRRTKKQSKNNWRRYERIKRNFKLLIAHYDRVEADQLLPRENWRHHLIKKLR